MKVLEGGVRTCREARMAEDQEAGKKTPPPFHIDSLLGRAPPLNHLSSDGRMDESCSQSLACTAAFPSSVHAQAAPPPSWNQPNATASTDRGKLKSKLPSVPVPHAHVSVEQHSSLTLRNARVL